MLYYRLYFMDPSNGHIVRFAEFEAPDDEAAIALASEHEGGQPLELWCQHRKVRRFEAVISLDRPRPLKRAEQVRSYASGRPKFKLFLFLEQHVGLSALRQHIWQVIGIGAVSSSKDRFDRNFYKVFPEAVPVGINHEIDFAAY